MKTLIVAILLFCAPVGASAADPAVKDEKVIRVLIDDLICVHEKVSETPLISPGTAGNDDKEYKRQFEKCQEAFKKLSELKSQALPILVEHLEDKRPSIHFRNHYMGHSVGDACYWNIYFQLQKRPSNYSEYGYQCEGRDGENHPKPYWAAATSSQKHVGRAFPSPISRLIWLRLRWKPCEQCPTNWQRLALPLIPKV